MVLLEDENVVDNKNYLALEKSNPIKAEDRKFHWFERKLLNEEKKYVKSASLNNKLGVDAKLWP